MTALINQGDRVFVAGHRGMAGSAICRALEANGYSNILTAPRTELDLTNAGAVTQWFAEHRPTVVVLAAAKVGGILANSSMPADFLLDNLKIQNNVIETAWRSGVRRLLFLGSSCIYPKHAEQPIKEEALLTGPLEPTNEGYAIAKIAGITLCRLLRQQYDFDAISLMPTNLYGPGDNYHPQHSHVLAAMIRRFTEAKAAGVPSVVCWGTGTPRRELMHVDDLAAACVFALERWRPDRHDPIQHLNVGTGVDITIAELAKMVADLVGYQGQIEWDTSKSDGTPRKLLDVERLIRLGWRSTIFLDDALHRLLDESRRRPPAELSRLK